VHTGSDLGMVQGTTRRPLVMPMIRGYHNLIYHCFATEWCKGVPVPIVWAIQYFLRGFCGIDPGCPHEVDAVLHLRCESVPQLEWEIRVRGC